MINRIIGIMKLDVATYEEVEHDPAATQQAAIIVLLVALISAFGAAATANFSADIAEQFGDQLGNLSVGAGLSPVGAFIGAIINTFLSWVLWAYGTDYVGRRFFNADSTPQEMLRVMGFAQAPSLLSFIPCIGVFASLWSLVCGFIAVRQGLDVDNKSAAFTIIILFVAVLIVTFVIGSLLAVIGLAAS